MTDAEHPRALFPKLEYRTDGKPHVFIHAKAFQRIRLLPKLFEHSEIGTYLLTMPPIDTLDVPPIDTALLYLGQELTRGHIQECREVNGVDCGEENRALLDKICQNVIGWHHSHGLHDAYQSKMDVAVSRSHIQNSAWNII